jgi:hypothetical protein
MVDVEAWLLLAYVALIISALLVARWIYRDALERAGRGSARCCAPWHPRHLEPAQDDLSQPVR